MAGSAPDATCTLSPEGTVTTVLVGARCKVTYEFDTSATSASLALPYVVAIDGQVQPEYAERPGALRDKRTIKLIVKPAARWRCSSTATCTPTIAGARCTRCRSEKTMCM